MRGPPARSGRVTGTCSTRSGPKPGVGESSGPVRSARIPFRRGAGATGSLTPVPDPHSVVWVANIEKTRARDPEVTAGLLDAGWTVVRLWNRASWRTRAGPPNAFVRLTLSRADLRCGIVAHLTGSNDAHVRSWCGREPVCRPAGLLRESGPQVGRRVRVQVRSRVLSVRPKVTGHRILRGARRRDQPALRLRRRWRSLRSLIVPMETGRACLPGNGPRPALP